MRKTKRKRAVKNINKIDIDSFLKLYSGYNKKLKSIKLELLHFLLTLKIGNDLLEQKELDIEGFGKISYENGIVRICLDEQIVSLIEGNNSLNILKRLFIC